METQQSLLNNVEDTDFEKRLATIVEILLNYDAHVNAETKAQETPLHFTVRRNCFRVAQLLVQRNANVDEVDEDRRTLLHLCAEFSDSKMAELLLKHYAIRPKTIGKKNEFIVDVNNQHFRTVKVELKRCKKRADKMHDEFIDIFKAHLQNHRLIDEQSRQEYKEYNGSYDAGDSCSCLSFLESAYNALIDKSRLIDWEQFWISYQNYQKAQCKYHTEHAKILLNELKDRINRFMARCMKQTPRHVNEMRMSENKVIFLNREYESCCSSPIFCDFRLQLACALCLNNNDAAPKTDFKDEAKENLVIEFFRLRPLNPSSYSECNFAVIHQSSKTLKMVENVKSYVNRKDSEGYDALLKAVEFNRPYVVQLLLRYGADTSSVTSQGYSALHVAINSIHNDVSKSSNPVEMIKDLLTTGEFSVNALTFKAETPLHLATSNCGCGLSGQDAEEFQSRRRIEDSIISLLLEYKANVNQQDCEGVTPLMIASEQGCYHIVQILLDWNFVRVDLNARDKYGETALIKAARMRHTEIVEALVKSGARVDLQEYRGFTALHAALHDPNEFTSLLKLLENESQDIGSSMIEVDEKVRSRVKDAALIGVTNSSNGKRDSKKVPKNAMIKILFCCRHQFETLDFANNTPFDFLVDSEIQSSRSEEEAQEQLDKIRNEWNVYKETPCNLYKRWLDIKWRRESPLFWLAAVCIMIPEQKSIHPEEAKEISRIKDYKGRTLLHYAAMSTGYEQLSDRNSLFKILLTLGCRIDEKDIYQRTPLHYLDVSSSNLLFGVSQQIGMESTEKQRVIFRDTLKVKDVDDKTVDELRSLREGIADEKG